MNVALIIFYMSNLSRLLVYFVIFGCARHSPNKFGSALACTKISSFTCLLVYSFTCLLKTCLLKHLFRFMLAYGFEHNAQFHEKQCREEREEDEEGGLHRLRAEA